MTGTVYGAATALDSDIGGVVGVLAGTPEGRGVDGGLAESGEKGFAKSTPRNGEVFTAVSVQNGMRYVRTFKISTM